MNKKLLLASTGAAVIAAAGFGSIALAQEDDPTSPSGGSTGEAAGGPTGELDAVPDDTATGDGREVFPSEGGTVFAECTADGPGLVWWVAADGYTVDDVEAAPDDDRDDDGDDDDAEVEFTNGTTDVDYDVTCVDGQPQANVTVEDERDDDGSDDDRDDDDGRDDDDHDDDWDDD